MNKQVDPKQAALLEKVKDIFPVYPDPFQAVEMLRIAEREHQAFRATVANALVELRAEMEMSLGELRDTDHWCERLDATIAKLGILPHHRPRRVQGAGD